jgi:hypothetical protein
MILGMPARRLTPSGPTDPFFSFVTLLLHMDGTDESQSWPDVINTTTWIRNGSASSAGPYVDTDEKQFGTASTRFESPSFGTNTGEYIGPTSRQQGHFMEEEDFVIEGWFRPVAPHISVGFWWSAGAQNSTLGLLLGVTPTTVWWRSNVFTDLSASVTISGSAWTHIAWVREGTARRIYVGGSLVASDSNGAFDNDDAVGSRLGGVSGDPRFAYRGWIDEVRITKGSIRGYSGSTITVPTEAFPDS